MVQCDSLGGSPDVTRKDEELKSNNFTNCTRLFKYEAIHDNQDE